MIEICFVCTGNTCRSVMAERIAKKMSKSMGLKDLKFSSRGLQAKKENITDNAKAALKQLGYDSRDRKSVPLTKLNPKTIYVAMTDSHKKAINMKNCISLSELYGEVPDPYMQPIEDYLDCAKLLEKNVEVLLKKIKNFRSV